MTQNEIQAVALAISEYRTGNTLSYRNFITEAEAAIAALDAARGDPVAQVVEWLRACSLSSAIPDDPAQMIADLADAIEQSFANKT